LVTAYIKKPVCLILLTVLCESLSIRSYGAAQLLTFCFVADLENQGAHRLTKRNDIKWEADNWFVAILRVLNFS
jgi:hypothetical protein